MKTKLKSDMEKFYSSSHRYLNQLKSHSLSAYSKYLKKIFKFVGKNKKILDIGCGAGQVANYLQEKGYKVAGIDISPLFIEEARKKGDAEFSVMDSTSLKFKNNGFDAVISAETLEHIPNPEKALEEIARVLKKSGLLVLRFPNKQSAIKNFLIRIRRKPLFEIVSPNLDENVKGEDEDLCYKAATSDVVVFLRKSGFKILYTKPFFWPSALIVARKL